MSLPVLFVLAFWAMLPAARAAEDHETARAAVEAGELRPLDAILNGLPGALRGELIDAELRQRRDGWNYMLKVLDGGGTVREITVDGASGQILGVEGR